MSGRERLAQLDSEGTAMPSSPSNPLAEFALRVAEGAIIAYVEYRDRHATDDVEDVDAWARAKALGEVSDALGSYGIVRGYPELLAAAKDATFALAAHGEQAIVYRLARARTLSEKSLVDDEPNAPSEPAETEEDLPW